MNKTEPPKNQVIIVETSQRKAQKGEEEKIVIQVLK